MAEYKIRSQKRARQAYTPYQREKGLVSRVWEWLAPSWWTGATGDEASPMASPRDTPTGPSTEPSQHTPISTAQPDSSLTHPPPLTQAHPPSFTQAHPPPLTQAHPPPPSQLPSDATPLPSPSTPLPFPPLMVAQPSSYLIDNRKLAGHRNGGTERGPDGMEQGPEDDSNSSWVAEDTSDEVEEGTGQTGVTGSLRGRTTGPSTVEHHVQRMVNPVFGVGPRPQGSGTSPSTFSTRTVSSTFSSRVLRTRPLSTSTPQLSPINEEGPPHSRAGSEQQGGGHSDRHLAHPSRGHASSATNAPQPQPSQVQAVDRLPSIPEQSLFHTTPMSTAPPTSQLFTDLSLSRSPFQSPFYSGRTSFGGAASRQKLRSTKRQRTESSPPVLAPIHHTVSARPLPTSHPPSLTISSTTARKILHTLETLSSPLADARKLPLRAGREEAEPARKRHKSAHATTSHLAPPPTAPLSTPSLNTPHSSQGPVIVPNERSLRRKTGGAGLATTTHGVTMRPASRAASTDTHTSPPQPPVKSTAAIPFTPLLRASTSAAPPSTTSPSLLTIPTSHVSPSLASIRFTAPPLPSLSSSPDHSKLPVVSPDRSDTGSRPTQSFTPTFHATSKVLLASGSGGKMRSSHTTTRKHISHRSDEQEEMGVEPVAMPPDVGLKVGKAMPQFGFAGTIMTPPWTSPSVSMGAKTPPNFSFSTPKAVVSEPLQVSPKPLSSSFQFSAPKNCTPTPSLLPKPTSSLLPKPSSTSALLPKPSISSEPSSATVTSRPPAQPRSSPAQAPPPLKNISVVDILKQPEYRSLTSSKPHLPSSSVPPPSQPPRSSEVVDLTEDEDEGEKPAKLKPLSAFAPPAGGWECGTCLVQNKPSDEKCVACGCSKPGTQHQVSGQVTLAGVRDKMPQLKPLAQFAPPKGSWSCDTCFVQNKSTDSKCVACGGLRPGAEEGGGRGGGGGGTESNSVVPPAQSSVQFGEQGGLQLGKTSLPKFTSSATTSSQPLPVAVEAQRSQPPPDKQSAAEVPLKPLAQFAPPEGAWSCDTCMVSNKPGDCVCVACGTPRAGGVASNKTAPPTTVAFGPGGGLKLGGGLQLGQGLKFGGEGPMTIGGGLKFGAAPLGAAAQAEVGKPGPTPGAQPETSVAGKPGSMPTTSTTKPILFGAQGGLKVGSGGLGTGLFQFGADKGQKSESAFAGSGLRLGGDPNLAAQPRPTSGPALGSGSEGVKSAEGTVKTSSESTGIQTTVGPSTQPSIFGVQSSSSSSSLTAATSSGFKFGLLQSTSGSSSNPLSGLKFGTPAAPLLPSTSSSSSSSSHTNPPTIVSSSFNFSAGVKGQSADSISKGTFQFSAAKAPFSSFTPSQPPALSSFTSTPSQPPPLSSLTSTPSQPPITTATPSLFTITTSGAHPPTTQLTSSSQSSGPFQPAQSALLFSASSTSGQTGHLFAAAASSTAGLSQSVFKFAGGTGQADVTTGNAGQHSKLSAVQFGANPSTGQTSQTGFNFSIASTTPVFNLSGASSNTTGFSVTAGKSNSQPVFNFSAGNSLNFSAGGSGPPGDCSTGFSFGSLKTESEEGQGLASAMFTTGPEPSARGNRVFKRARRRRNV